MCTQLAVIMNWWFQVSCLLLQSSICLPDSLLPFFKSFFRNSISLIDDVTTVSKRNRGGVSNEMTFGFGTGTVFKNFSICLPKDNSHAPEYIGSSLDSPVLKIFLPTHGSILLLWNQVNPFCKTTIDGFENFSALISRDDGDRNFSLKTFLM